MGKKWLQLATAILCLIPLTTGCLIMFRSFQQPFYAPGLVAPNLDSTFRALGGIWLGLGIAGFWLIPTIERQTILYRAIWLAVFFAGIGRIISWIHVGPPLPFFIALMVPELIGPPIFVYWQYRVASAASAAARSAAAIASPA
jgi:hypothetical protein